MLVCERASQGSVRFGGFAAIWVTVTLGHRGQRQPFTQLNKRRKLSVFAERKNNTCRHIIRVHVLRDLYAHLIPGGDGAEAGEEPLRLGLHNPPVRGENIKTLNKY